MLEDRDIELLVVCVDWRSNAEIYLSISRCAIPALLETPLAPHFEEAAVVAQALERRGGPTEIAEQYFRRPIEVLKRQLVANEIFGRVFYAFNEGVGHEYHGISLIRSYLGFNQKLRRVSAVQRDVPCFPHKSHRDIFFPGERIQHALLEFESGDLAAYHWSWLSYASPVRFRRVAGFHATLGAACGEEMVAFENKDDDAIPIAVHRRARVVDGVEILHDLVALQRDRVVARWSNPVPGILLNEEQIVAASLILSLVEVVRGNAAPTYPPSVALEDLRIVDAISSAAASTAWQKV
jgi:predicted dehydrogenase